MLEVVKSEKCLVGYRGWNLFHPHYLTSGNLVTEPMKRAEAKCKKDHLPPDENCTCGIYAFKSQESLVDQGYSDQKVLGECWMWGKVIEHERGYKAQFSYPKKLFIVDRQDVGGTLSIDAVALAPYLGYIYGVPHEVISANHPMVRRAPKLPVPGPAYQPVPSAQRNVYYAIKSTLYVALLPPQARILVKVIADLAKVKNPVPETDLIKALMLEGQPGGRLKTVQHPWRIFKYYCPRLIEEGIVTKSKGPRN